MMRFDRITLGRQAKELGFVRDTFEKVCRLADVLSFYGKRWAACGQPCPERRHGDQSDDF